MGEKWLTQKQEVIIGFVIGMSISASVFAWVYISYPNTGGPSKFNSVTITEVGGNYHVEITRNYGTHDIEDLKFLLVDNMGGAKYSKNGTPLYEEELTKITVKAPPINHSFYESDSDADPLNSTDISEFYYYIVFVDENHNGKLNVGDWLLVRSRLNGGVIKPGDVFRIINDLTRHRIFEAEF